MLGSVRALAAGDHFSFTEDARERDDCKNSFAYESLDEHPALLVRFDGGQSVAE